MTNKNLLQMAALDSSDIGGLHVFINHKTVMVGRAATANFWQARPPKWWPHQRRPPLLPPLSILQNSGSLGGLASHGGPGWCSIISSAKLNFTFESDQNSIFENEKRAQNVRTKYISSGYSG
jgi:hypothetical protein